MTFRSTITFFCIFIICDLTVAQTQNKSQHDIDSLLNRDFDFLENKLLENQSDTLLANLYGKAYLKKAKINLTQNKTIDEYYYKYYLLSGYYLLSLINDYDTSIKYSDSVILNSRHKELQNFLPPTYLNLGNLHYNKGAYELALDNYIAADKVLDKENNPELYYATTHNIGSIKTLVNQHKEALKIHKDYDEYIEAQKLKEENIDNYLSNLFSLAASYGNLGYLDSCSRKNSLGFKQSQLYEKPNHKAKFILGEGYNLYDKKQYVLALDSINIALPLLQKSGDSLNLALGYLYKSKALKRIGREGEIANFLKKTDTIITKKASIHPEFLETYELLFEYYKSKRDLKNQLVYMERLMSYDKKLELRYVDLHKIVTRGYDIPKLIVEKENLIKTLEEKNNISTLRFYLLSIFSGILLLTSFYYYRNKIIYKKRFEELMTSSSFSTRINDEKVSYTLKEAELGIPKKIQTLILTQLREFEIEKKFLDSTLSLSILSKLFGTNSSYLSKTINFYKDKNFSSYITDLRINYIIEELKHNTQLQNYTVKAIAFEIGFRNSESFTNAFHKKTGLYPSYYIKKIKKNLQTV